ncbi:cysteine peptidase family C39 domain-containing protein [Candidatus Omnitrophota bacterium]
MLLVNVAIADIFISWRHLRTTSVTSDRLKQLTPYGIILLLFVANLLYGAWSLRLARLALSGPSVDVLMMQPAMESKLYQQHWRLADPQDAGDFIGAFLGLSRTLPPPEPGKPLIGVWPEGGNDFYSLRIPWIRRVIYNVVTNRQAYLAMSSIDLSEEGQEFNTIFWVGPEGSVIDRYDKLFLVPVGEANFTPGESTVVFEAPYINIGPMLCAESSFPQYARGLTRRGADVLLISSNDASFRRSGLSLAHTRMAIVRAVESRKPVLLNANVGPSMIVDPYGHIQARTEFWERTILKGIVVPVAGISFYHRIGYLFGPLVLGLLFFLILRAVIAHKRASSPTRVVEGFQTNPRLLSLAGVRTIVALLTAAGIAVLICIASLLKINQLFPQPLPAHIALAAFMRDVGPVIPTILGPEFRQATSVTCGSAALAYLLSYMGKRTNEKLINQLVKVTPRGINMFNLKYAAQRLGFKAWGEKQNYEALRRIAKPVIAHVSDDHYVVVTWADRHAVVVFDPALGGRVRLLRHQFEQFWKGTVLLIRPKPIPSPLKHVGGV